MNERVMQFRIGMFVIVAGLVLTMLIVWFGESPVAAPRPGLRQGPLRRGARRGRGRSRCARAASGSARSSAIAFDDRPNQPDGVLVTLALERKYKLRDGLGPAAHPVADRRRDDRHAARHRHGPSRDQQDPRRGPGHRGRGRPDPSKALAAATKAFEKAGDTLKSIDEAAAGLVQAHQERRQARRLPHDLDDDRPGRLRGRPGHRPVHRDQRGRLPAGRWPTSARSPRSSTTPSTPRPRTRFKTGIDRFSVGLGPARRRARRRSSPLLKDLGSPVNHTPTTDFGQAVRRLNLIAADLELLTSKLRDGQGRLNTDGSLQKLLTQSELHDNFNPWPSRPTRPSSSSRPSSPRSGLRREGLSRSRP